MENKKIIIKWVTFGIVGVLTLAIRLYALGDRPFHNDEGVNYHFLREVLSSGIYPYSHKNYHGPTYFYLLGAVSYLFGISDFTQRFASVLPTLVLLPFVLFAFTYVSWSTRAFVATLLALSTTFNYYSRYSIHESLLVLFSMLGVLYAYKWCLLKRDRDLIFLFVTLSMCIATKETFIIHLASLVFSMGMIFPFRRILSSLTSNLPALAWAIFFGIFIILFFYSGFFRSIEGIKELFLGVPQWVGRGHSDVGHHKPLWYYFRLIYRVEPIALIVVLPLSIYFFRLLRAIIRRPTSNGDTPKPFIDKVFQYAESGSSTTINQNEKVAFAFSLYALASFIAYSYVPYKTPWLIINITVPATIGFGLFLPSFVKSRLLLALSASMIVLFSGYYSLKFNFLPERLGRLNRFVNSAGVVGDQNPLAYVHTREGTLALKDRIDAYMKAHPKARILVAVTSYWPLPYYLREYQTQLLYSQGADPAKYFDSYDIIIANKEKIEEKSGWERIYFRLSDNQESQVYFKTN